MGLIKHVSFFIFLKNEITSMKFVLNSDQKDLIKWIFKFDRESLHYCYLIWRFLIYRVLILNRN